MYKALTRLSISSNLKAYSILNATECIKGQKN